MRKLHFHYSMSIRYTLPASLCRFTMKCVPQDTLRQKISDVSIRIVPETPYMEGQDSFGNKSIYGCVNEPHTLFLMEVSGIAQTNDCTYEEEEQEGSVGIFRYPYGYNRPGEQLRRYSKKLDEKIAKRLDASVTEQHIEGLGMSQSGIQVQQNLSGQKNADGYSAYATCVELLHRLYADFRYQPGSTNVTTTAEEAWNLGCGVCQDYAHIYLALLHLRGIPARYVTGMIPGEGASHAWVEALCDGKWYGFDPTNDTVLTDEYIRIGIGRDASDCLINRGLMRGGGQQEQEIHVVVEDMTDNVYALSMSVAQQ